MSREKCCGSFPEYVCGDCPHANDEQKAMGGVSLSFIGNGVRCSGCFMTRADHTEPGTKCPPANVPVPPPPPVEVVVLQQKKSVPVAAPARPPSCPSCSKPWNGQRVPRGIEGVYCGTCGQQAFFS